MVSAMTRSDLRCHNEKKKVRKAPQKSSVACERAYRFPEKPSTRTRTPAPFSSPSLSPWRVDPFVFFLCQQKGLSRRPSRERDRRERRVRRERESRRVLSASSVNYIQTLAFRTLR